MLPVASASPAMHPPAGCTLLPDSQAVSMQRSIRMLITPHLMRLKAPSSSATAGWLATSWRPRQRRTWAGDSADASCAVPSSTQNSLRSSRDPSQCCASGTLSCTSQMLTHPAHSGCHLLQHSTESLMMLLLWLSRSLLGNPPWYERHILALVR